MQAATDRLNNVGPRGNYHWLGWEIRHPGGVVAEVGIYSVYTVSHYGYGAHRTSNCTETCTK